MQYGNSLKSVWGGGGKYVHKPGFTLAEVLITLGIIGVVAAMTLPTLVAKYKKKVIATRVKQAYSIISNAIKLSEAENGEAKYWNSNLSSNGIKNTELFLNKYILPYLNNAIFCGDGLGDDVVEKCGATVSIVGKTYILPNGVSAAFVSAGSRGIALETNILYVTLDANGKDAPNIHGSDKFFFVLSPNKGFIPFGGDANISDREDILRGINVPNDGETSFIACKQIKSNNNDAYYRHGCTLLLMFDGWEFKDDYPFIF